MLKSLGDLIHRTSWLALIGGGISILIGLVLFTAPIHLLRLSDSGRTPQEKSAIKREINLAFGERALTIAESVVHSMRSRSVDPERIRDFDVALGEMARARGELARAEAEIAGAAGNAARERAAVAREAASEANRAALETATEAARSALESAVDSREAIEQTRDQAVERLRERNIDPTATQKSFDDLLKSARDNEKTARESLAAIKALPAQARSKRAAASVSKPPQPLASSTGEATGEAGTGGSSPAAGDLAPAAVPAPPTSPGNADKPPAAAVTPEVPPKKPKNKISISFDTDDPKGAVTPLPPEVRRDIRAKVAGDVWRVGIGSALIVLYVPLFLMVLTAKYLLGRSRRALAFAEEKKNEAKVSDINRQITEARLQALQAQVEPHFLYNTLANVQALTEFDPPAANAMVGHLIQYLRAALPKMRESTSTIGQEVELIRAYLNILKMRMGDRLEFAIDVPPDLMTRPFPPMMLPSLVENAIKHGLEPVREGGRIDVVASRVTVNGAERVRLEVRDTGRGLSDAPVQSGSGVGLTNLRERLYALHGDNASFTIEANAPRGVRAAIEVPLLGAGAAPTSAATGAAPGNGAAAGFQPAPEQSASGHPSPQPDVAPVQGWRRAWRATSKTHSVWASIVSKVFFGLMLALAVFFALSLIALYSGSLPIDIGDLRLEGIEGKALGSVLLLVAFVVATLVAAILAAVFYGLGFVFAGLLIIVPALILVSIFPVVAPFIVIGMLIYWLFRRRRKKKEAAATAGDGAAEGNDSLHTAAASAGTIDPGPTATSSL